MISKIFLFFVLVRLAFISSEDEFSQMPKLQTIQNETFRRMSQYTPISWNQTAQDRQNYHMFPILARMRNYFSLMYLYHFMELERFFPQDEFLERPYALARILDKLQNTSDVELKFPNAIFHDRSFELWRYLDDLKLRFHTESYKMYFDPQNEQSVTEMINNWTSRVTYGRQPKQIYENLAAKKRYRATFLSFTGCWESKKNHMISFVLNKRRKRSIPAVSGKTTTLRFERIKEGIEVHWFSGRDTIGYYEDVERKFKSISIPFKNKKFAMIVMLPNHNQSLEIFRNFTAEDYRQVLQRVNETYHNVDYTIPVINSQTIVINRNGASINGGKLCNPAETPEEITTNNFDHKLFIVDRPFGVIIYHEPTSLVLMYALVRNPASHVWPNVKYHYRIDN